MSQMQPEFENGAAKEKEENVMDVDVEEEDDEESDANLPSHVTYKQEHMRSMQERTVIVGPTRLDDLKHPALHRQLKYANQFAVRFFKEQLDGDEEEIAFEDEEKELTGHVEMRFKTVQEAERCVRGLENFRKGIKVKRFTRENTSDSDVKAMKKQQMARANKSVMTITDLDESVTAEQIKMQIPGALDVIIPRNDDNQFMGHAYVEVATSRVKDIEHSEILIRGMTYRLRSLNDVLAPAQLIKNLKKELMFISKAENNPLNPSKRQHLEQLVVVCTEYETNDYIQPAKKAKILRACSKINDHLKEDERIREDRKATKAANAAMQNPPKQFEYPASPPRGGRGRGWRGGRGRGFGGYLPGYAHYDYFGGLDFEEGTRGGFRGRKRTFSQGSQGSGFWSNY